MENVAELNGCMKNLTVERGFGRVRLRRVRWLHEMPETSKSTSQTLVVRFAPWRRGVLSSVGCRSLGRVDTVGSLGLSVSRTLAHSAHSLSVVANLCRSMVCFFRGLRCRRERACRATRSGLASGERCSRSRSRRARTSLLRTTQGAPLASCPTSDAALSASLSSSSFFLSSSRSSRSSAPPAAQPQGDRKERVHPWRRSAPSMKRQLACRSRAAAELASEHVISPLPICMLGSVFVLLWILFRREVDAVRCRMTSWRI